jgi:hypothetical protein
MASTIEVRVAGTGSVRDSHRTTDPKTEAHCDLCDTDAEVVVSTTASGGAPFACRVCLRQRLEATTIAIYELRGSEGLPWGKISG